MKIGLIDVDGHNFPNIPLMKLSTYHRAKGDHVEWWCGLSRYDIVYKSKVFTFTPDIEYMPMADQVIKGGTGYGIKNKLPKEVERCMPDYSLYPQFKEAYGFLTRGCPRNCNFCCVTQKEGGRSKQVADLKQFWSGQREIKLCDPNLLACRDHEKLLQQLIVSGSRVDFTQGLDIRLVNRDNAELIKRVKVKNIHFAWDNPKQDLTRKFQQFKEFSQIDYRKLSVYVLTNFNSSLEDDLYRIYTLRDLGYSPYVMIYNKQQAPQQIRHLQRWCNNRIIFKSVVRFEDYDPKLA